MLDKYKTPTNEPVALDPGLIQDYTSKLPNKEVFKAPFISNYTYGDKNLVFVATERQEDPKPETQITIEKAIKDFAPEFIIVEGSAFTIISDPDDVAYAKECQKKKYKLCAEDAYTIHLAVNAGIPFCYGDPSDAAIHASLKKNGITDDEIIVFYTLKSIPAWKRDGIKPTKELQKAWKKKFNELLAKSSKKFRAKKPMTEAQFKKIYKLRMGAEFNFADISNETISPAMDNNPMWSNRMAHSIDILKEQFLTKQIETRMNKYKKVMVVYGATHLMKARPMFSRALGEPVDSSALKK
jgi:hypothetical protein